MTEINARSVPFYDKRKLDLGLLVCGETFLALTAAATTPNDMPFLGFPGFDNRRTVCTAERASHARFALLAVHREAFAQCRNLLTHLGQNRLVIRRIKYIGDQMGNLLGFDFGETTGGHGR